MVSEALQRAREYEAEFACPEAGRPVFHMTPTVGWMNDPNGFSVYQGEYHLFYQYHPYSTNWGPMHWGHVKTKDFIKWERLPAALAPDQAYDKGGCFSGSALELPDGRQLLVYTGVQQYAEAGGTMKERQAQCIAIGDGIDYEKSGLNPVLNETALPPGGSPADFRDPKIWQEPDGSYRLVAANRAGDGSGAALLFGSRDALHWDLLSTLDASGWKFGGMWECPDCFRLGDRQVLMLSPQEMLPVGLDFHAGNNTAWLIGRMEPGSIAFVRQIVQPVDYGIDFYAPQTLLAPDGRRIMIAWMQNWETAAYKMEGCPWFGQMTLPRELRMENGKILQLPVRELEAYRRHRIAYQDVAVQEAVTLPGVHGRVLDMTLTLRPTQAEGCFRLRFAQGGPYVTTLSCDLEHGIATLDRSASGLRWDTLHSRTFPAPLRGGTLKLRLVLDRFSAELFLNDGAQAASTTLYTPAEADGISFEANQKVVMELEKYDLVL